MNAPASIPPDKATLRERASRIVESRSRGFSLIELLGVLAIMVILTASVVPPIFRQMRIAEQQSEAGSVEAIAKAFEQVVRESKVLPGSADWLNLVQTALDRPPQSLGFGAGGCPREMIYHPLCPISPGENANEQTAAGFQSIPPGFDRVMVVSTVRDSLPTAYLPESPKAFEALWNLEPHRRPAGWSAEALPDPDDLQIARIDLNRLMHQVVINNVTSDSSPARISLEENGTVFSIARQEPSVPWQTSFIHGTGLNLHGPDGQVWARELINGDRTLYYGDNGWGLSPPPGPGDISSTVIPLVEAFLAAEFPDAKNNQRPRAAIDELYRTLWTYMDWAEAGFLEGGNNKNQAPDAYVVRSTVARLNQGTLNLIGSGGGGN
ncbi:MAG: type II secretion system protein [Verrucomicrobiales bacterium]|nr:type II secretion system protein [Verrucomicrobiales bacterium]MCP5526451.1 type II secretion system protein [Verrucomicrobiales bacterium]